MSFTQDWFTRNVPPLVHLIVTNEVKSILEIGSFEGLSAVSFLTAMKDGGITCIDPWEDAEVKNKFDENMEKFKGSATVIQGYSSSVLPMMHGQFDMIYIDGSHDAKDVLLDAVLSYRLCKVGGLMVFDDYLWGNRDDPLSCPKLAIDAFTACFARQVEILTGFPLWQLYVRKLQ